MRIFLLFFFVVFGFQQLSAQKFLAIERSGKSKNIKIFIGEMIEYKTYDSDDWSIGVIEDLLIDEDVVVLGNRYIQLSNIQKLRYARSWTRAFGTSLFWFGVSWSGFALVGTATDGNPDTQYEWRDVIVTSTSWLLAWAVPKIFKYRTFTFGKRKRLRMLDLTIEPTKKSRA
ncbi:MAG: hypothetical protein MK226_04555 [Saprospiraceae bacterium]|jgi:hypothetical protein|nr:hypothetical protein [Saprospiraceae bacterium]